MANLCRAPQGASTACTKAVMTALNPASLGALRAAGRLVGAPSSRSVGGGHACVPRDLSETERGGSVRLRKGLASPSSDFWPAESSSCSALHYPVTGGVVSALSRLFPKLSMKKPV